MKNKFNNLEINYLELSFISGKTSLDKLNSDQCKAIFRKELKIEEDQPLRKTDLICVSKLYKYFKNIKSVDKRYDNINELVFVLNHKSKLYKKYLSNLGVIQSKFLLGGKSILWKIMSDSEKQHFTFIVTSKNEDLKRCKK